MTQPTTYAERTAKRITLDTVTVRYGNFCALDKISIHIEPGELLALLGPSGCGKTTTLKVISGLQPIDSGRVLFDDVVVNEIAPNKRNVGMVFQNYALFPHMTVQDNLMFGLKMHRVPPAERRERIESTLDMLQIGAYANSWPDQLSGGQQQRVALARSVVVRPAVLLLDEPLSALDRQLRDSMRMELRTLLKKVGITTVIVTHDQEEALTIADRVAVIRAGLIEQIGTPRQIYLEPRSRFVASFIGHINYLSGSVLGSERGLNRVRLTGADERIVVCRSLRPLKEGDTVDVAIRPEVITIDAVGADSGDIDARNRLSGRIVSDSFVGGTSQYVVALDGGGSLVVSRADNARGSMPTSPDARISLSWPVERSLIIVE